MFVNFRHLFRLVVFLLVLGFLGFLHSCVMGDTGPCKVDQDCERYGPIHLYCSRAWCVPAVIRDWVLEQDRRKEDAGPADSPPIDSPPTDQNREAEPDSVISDAVCAGGATRPCYTGPTATKGKGECKPGVEVCKDGAWGSCSGDTLPAKKDDCDKKDNDCDGQVDEDCVCKSGDKQACYPHSVGCKKVNDNFQCQSPCQVGEQTCTNNKWSDCQDSLGPKKDVCGNGLDEDCDGLINESCVETFAGVAKTIGSKNSPKPLFSTFSSPSFLSVRGSTLYIFDSGNKSIRVIDLISESTSTLVTGLQQVGGMAVDFGGNVYISLIEQQTIQKVTIGGSMTTFAGQDNKNGTKDGAALTNALFFQPKGLSFDASGNLFVADSGSHTIRKINTSGQVSTIAGVVGQSGTNDHASDPKQAKFNSLEALVIHKDSLYVVEMNGGRLREVHLTSGKVRTIASGLNSPTAITADKNGLLYIVETANHVIKKILPPSSLFGNLAGLGSQGYEDGEVGKAKFSSPRGLALYKGSLYIADTDNHVIRKIILEP